MPNGATNWNDNQVLWCEQGRTSSNSPAALVTYNGQGDPVTLLDSYDGLPFSSLNDVVVHTPSGTVFFTDPDYGVEQGFRDPQTKYAPNALYSWNPATGQVRLCDDDYSKRKLPSLSPLSFGFHALLLTRPLFVLHSHSKRCYHPTRR